MQLSPPLRILAIASSALALAPSCGGDSSSVAGTGGIPGTGASPGLGGSGAIAGVENPSGDCAAEGDGSRPCYHALGPSDQYVPDCQNPLQREYWRVFYTENGTAYVIPRPDGVGLVFGICDDTGQGDDADLAALFDDNGLCDEQADIPLISSMALDEALSITRALHERLEFTAGPMGIEPQALIDDLHVACQESEVDLSSADGVCSAVDDIITGNECVGPPPFIDEVSAPALADALNDIYGI